MGAGFTSKYLAGDTPLSCPTSWATALIIHRTNLLWLEYKLIMCCGQGCAGDDPAFPAICYAVRSIPAKGLESTLCNKK
jgi:hypothetical protein